MADPTDVTPGPSTAPVATATPAAPAATAEPKAPEAGKTPTVSEDVNHPEGNTPPKTVPYERFQEVNDKANKAAADAEEMKATLARLGDAITPKAADDGIDPEADKLLRDAGYVRKDEVTGMLRDYQVEQQVKSEMDGLKSKYKEQGLTFDPQEVMKYADEKLGGKQNLQSAEAFEAAFIHMKLPEIQEAAKKAGIDAAHTPGGYSEKPTTGGAKHPGAEAPQQGLSTRDRIKQAMTKTGATFDK